LITPSNGTGPYTFVLDGTVTQTGATSTTFTGLAAGPHSVLITDASGCVSNPVPINIPAGAALTTAVNRTNVLCNGGTTGTITITPPPGNAPFSYSLDGTNWQAGNIFTGLGAGSYTAYFREGNGCQGSQPITITEPAVLGMTAGGVPVICNGAGNGTITLTTSGGTTPYQYSLNGGPFQANNVFNVPAGLYNIIIRDGNGCTNTQSITITEPAVLAASSGTTNASCDGGNDGRITVTATGGNSSYQYSIDGTNFQPSNVFNVGPGNYTVTVKDNLGCTTGFPATVGLTNNLTVARQTDPTICESKSVQLQLTSNATVYSWLPATGLSNPAISNPVASPVVSTEYIVTATLGRCSAEDTVIVNVNPAPVPDAGEDGYICYGQTYQLQGSGGVQYTWTPSTYLSSTAIASPVSTPAQTIVYTLSKVTDANGCESLVTDAMTLDVTPPIKVTTFPADTIAYAGDQFPIQATSLANIYVWSPATGLSDPAVSNPVVTVGNAGDDVIYQVTASTAAGCRGEGYVRIRVYKGPAIYMPGAFTPNNDGKNDRFIPLTVGIKQINYFKVFNRWGREVFSTKKIGEGWDGKVGGLEQSTGVYVWIVQGVTKDDRIITQKGTVVIIR
jgi:gliding motility-associated-like protein